MKHYYYEPITNQAGQREFAVRKVSSPVRFATCSLEENASFFVDVLNFHAEACRLGIPFRATIEPTADDIPDRSVMFIRTGEIRPPKDGEWFLDLGSCVMRACVDFDPGNARSILQRFVMRKGELVLESTPGAAA